MYDKSRLATENCDTLKHPLHEIPSGAANVDPERGVGRFMPPEKTALKII